MFSSRMNLLSIVSNLKLRLVTLVLLIPFALMVPRVALGSTYYLDSSVAKSGNGTSWAAAWKNFSNITGLHAGDVVNISGGTTGQTYTTGQFLSASGTSGNPITYQVATDSAHDGLVTIKPDGSGSPNFFYASASQGIGQWVTFTGNVNGSKNLLLTGWNPGVSADGSSGITFRYMTFQGQIHMNGASIIELDHVLLDLPINSDRALQGGLACSGTATYGINKIHDSIIQLRYGNQSGFGDDGIGGMECTAFYNNQVLGIFDATYTWSQHQDGIQTGGQYNSIYNNYFNNLQNYPIYGDQVGGGTLQHWRIYNNVFYDPSTSQGNQAVSIGCDGTSCTQNDILVANNTAVSNVNCIYLNQGTAGTLTGAYVINNICYNSGGMQVSTATQSNNTTSTTGITFVSATSDWHLQASSTSAIGQGISPSYLTAVSTTDKDGNQRTSPWDIGAYQYNGVAQSSPSPPTNVVAVVK